MVSGIYVYYIYTTRQYYNNIIWLHAHDGMKSKWTNKNGIEYGYCI